MFLPRGTVATARSPPDRPTDRELFHQGAMVAVLDEAVTRFAGRPRSQHPGHAIWNHRGTGPRF